MYLIAGLGNIGQQYNLTRHNIGFEAVDYLAERYGIPINKEKFNGKYGQGLIEGKKAILLKPSTYMNLSGECIGPFMNFFDIEPEKLLVLYDDIDFETGSVRIRKKGSGGTHNGMKNIIYVTQTTDFPRIRIGIGNDKRMDLASYVLSRFKPEEIPLMREAVIKTADIVRSILIDGIDNAMNDYNPRKAKNTQEENSDDPVV